MYDKNMFKNAKEQRKVEQRADYFAERDRESKCEWSDPGDVLMYEREKYRDQRLQVIDHVTNKTRICPCCQKVKPNPGQWVLSKHKRWKNKTCMCRVCFTRWGIGGFKKVMFKINRSEFSKLVAVGKYVVYNFSKYRRKSGMSQNAFAELMGWSGVWQSIVEKKLEWYMEGAVYLKIVGVMESCGAVFV